VSPCDGVVQAVKAICMVLNQIETLDIARAVKRLVDLVKGGSQVKYVSVCNIVISKKPVKIYNS